MKYIFIGFDKNIKLSVPSSDDRKVIAILTCSDDMTPKSSLFKLLRLYQKYYTDTHAVKLLLKYLKIDSGFLKLPTIEEMQSLFMLHYRSNREKAAEILNIPVDTLLLRIQDIEENKLIEHDLSRTLTQIHKTLAEKVNISMRNLLKIALVANIFEWYEFTIYAYLANIIGQIFFDAGSSVSGIIKVFSIFAIGILLAH